MAQTIREAELEVSVSVADAVHRRRYSDPVAAFAAPVAKIECRVKYAEFTRSELQEYNAI